MDVVLETPSPPPPPPPRTSRTFFYSAEASEALPIAQALRLSAVYKSTKVHLGKARTDNEHTNIL